MHLGTPELVVLYLCVFLLIGGVIDVLFFQVCASKMLMNFPINEWTTFDEAAKVAGFPLHYVRRALLSYILIGIFETRLNEEVSSEDPATKQHYWEALRREYGCVEFFEYRLTARPRFVRRLKESRAKHDTFGLPVPA